MSIENLLKYLKTYSSYNNFKDSHPEESDPIEIVEKRLENEKEIRLKTKYFMYVCYNPK